MTTEEAADKFLDCADFAKFPIGQAKSVVELVRKLETTSDIRTLTTQLSRT